MAEQEVKQEDPGSTMESPSDLDVTSPGTPQASENPPSPKKSAEKQPTSATTLKERLKKTRFSFNSCCSVVKRLKVENEENDEAGSEKSESSSEENCLDFHEKFKHIDSDSEDEACSEHTFKNIRACKSESLDSDSENPKQGLNEEKAELMKQIQEKEDLLRRIRLAKMYRSKNDLSQLQLLISKWRSCTQQVLCELQSILSEDNENLTLTDLIDHYGLDDKLLRYNRNEEDFTGV